MMPAAQTIAQAKASFKARGRPSLTDKEQRQLQRACELQQRAERIKEQEKKRAAAAAKRKFESDLDAKERQKALLGTQRKKDRFGYKSSQFHLGAFLKVGGRNDEINSRPTRATEQAEEDDFFQDDDLDDETLLGAIRVEPLDSTVNQAQQIERDTIEQTKSCMMLPPPLPRPQVALKAHQPVRAPCIEEDLSSFWDDLESSTQVARDLESLVTTSIEDPASSLNTSFGSGIFDLTVEELDKLDPPMHALPAAKFRPQTAPIVNMPPPRVPTKVTSAYARPQLQSRTLREDPAKSLRRQEADKSCFLTAGSHHCAAELGFTLTQLETFVDDDLQLTQAGTG